MILLLDTNAFIWAMSDLSKLGRRALSDISNPAHHVYVSQLSFLECAIKQRNGKLDADIDLGKIEGALLTANIAQLPFEPWAAQRLVDLPQLKWTDPFDAALIAQAVAKKMILVTADRHILNSQVSRLRTMDATV